MSFKTPYCSVIYADGYNQTTEWLSTSFPNKELALSQAALYIDQWYTCVDKTDWEVCINETIPDYSCVPEEVQYSNAILAEMHILGTLTTKQEFSGPITETEVKAGSVMSKKVYQGSFASYTGSKFNEIEEVTRLLSPYCTFGASNSKTTRV